MVGTRHHVSTTPDTATRDAVRVRLAGQSHRFLSVDDRGRLTVRMDRLTLLVTEIVTEHVTERTESLRAELDAATDAVVDLIDERDAVLRELNERVA